MKTFDSPEWMIAPFLEHGISQYDYYLYGSGRALAFVRMAAYALDERPDDQKVAEYHAYTGISAARTAIDAIASWLNVQLQLSLSPSPQINLSRNDFRNKVLKVQALIKEQCQALGALGTTIDEHRQRAQHREGVAIIHYTDSKKTGLPGGRHLVPKGLGGDRFDVLSLPNLLNGWASEIEAALQEIHKTLIPSSQQTTTPEGYSKCASF